MSHTVQNKKSLITRVRRIGGQVASLEKALEADADCDAVLQQAASIRGAVQYPTCSPSLSSGSLVNPWVDSWSMPKKK